MDLVQFLWPYTRRHPRHVIRRHRRPATRGWSPPSHRRPPLPVPPLRALPRRNGGAPAGRRHRAPRMALPKPTGIGAADAPRRRVALCTQDAAGGRIVPLAPMDLLCVVLHDLVHAWRPRAALYPRLWLGAGAGAGALALWVTDRAGKELSSSQSTGNPGAVPAAARRRPPLRRPGARPPSPPQSLDTPALDPKHRFAAKRRL